MTTAGKVSLPVSQIHISLFTARVVFLLQLLSSGFQSHYLSMGKISVHTCPILNIRVRIRVSFKIRVRFRVMIRFKDKVRFGMVFRVRVWKAFLSVESNHSACVEVT